MKSYPKFTIPYLVPKLNHTQSHFWSRVGGIVVNPISW